jgi:hypothetical protein
MYKEIQVLDKLLTNFAYENGKLINICTNTEIKHKTNSNGYFVANFGNTTYLYHRLIFLFHHQTLSKMIDHINHNKTDNRIENLRAATNTQNQQNANLRRDNASGIKNVHWHAKTSKWRVCLRVNKKKVWIGEFIDIELAELVATEARNKHHGVYACHG